VAAAAAIRALRDHFPLLAETPDVLDRWFELVDRCQVAGKRGSANEIVDSGPAEFCSKL
jgi:hypothetical protein